MTDRQTALTYTPTADTCEAFFANACFAFVLHSNPAFFCSKNFSLNFYAFFLAFIYSRTNSYVIAWSQCIYIAHQFSHF